MSTQAGSGWGFWPLFGDASTPMEIFMPGLGHVAQPPEGTGVVQLMPEQIPAAIAAFEQAKERMVTVAEKARRGTGVAPPGGDPVSVEVARTMTEAGQTGEHSAASAAAAAVGVFDQAIEQLEHMMQLYRVNEEHTARSFDL